MSELLESKIEQFVKLGGYDIVRQIKRGKNKGKWRNISEASRRTKISRPTIYLILEKYPEKPSKVKPKYMENLEESEGYRAIEQMYKSRVGESAWQVIRQTLKKAVKIIGYNKDPISYTEEDYKTLWYHEDLHSEEHKGIRKDFGIALHQLMRATNNHNLLEKFKYNNPPSGKKKQWFLHTDDIRKLIQEIETKETLLLVYLGIATGARHSGLMAISVDKIDFNDKVLQVYEKKVRHYVLKYPAFPVMRFLEQYVKDMRLEPTDKIFQHDYHWHLQRMREAGKRAGINKKVSTHILKHTFVTQAHRHGVSGDTISDQCGTELRCLVAFYRAKDETRLRHEMQGTTYNFKPFHEWIAELDYFFRAAYAGLTQ